MIISELRIIERGYINFMNLEKAKFIKPDILLIAILLILGTYMRVIGIERPDGLWYDELNTYFIAKQQFPLGILQNLFIRDLHCPLYYMLLHIWMNIFGNADVALRTLSLLFGILTLPISYLVGKRLAGQEGGIITLFFFSINSGLIYYSQEVRFYSLLVFFTTLSAFFLIKLKDTQSKLDYSGLIISNLIIIYTFTIGIFFVLIESLAFATYLIATKKSYKQFLLSNLITFILSIPIIILLIYFHTKQSSFLLDYFGYYQFRLRHVLTILNSIGGPLPPFHWASYILRGNFLIWVSTAIFSAFTIKAISKRDFTSVLFLIGLIFFLIELALSLLNKFLISYNHLIMAVPLFIITASYGVLQFKNKKILSLLLGAYFLINWGYFIYSPISVKAMMRGDGYNLITNGLSLLNATEKDLLIIFPLGGEVAKKYNYQARVAPLYLNDYTLNNGIALKYVFDDNFVNSLNKDNVCDKLTNFINSKKTSAKFKNYMQNDLMSTVPIDSYIFVVIPNSLYRAQKAYSYKTMENTIDLKILGDMYNIINSDNRFIPIMPLRTPNWDFSVFKRIK